MRWVHIMGLFVPLTSSSSIAMEEPLKILTIGHRGCAGLRLENTMAGFRHACELGVDGIEFDVHLTKDGIVVVHHDYYLQHDFIRDVSGSWVKANSVKIIDHSYQSLKAYKLGLINPDSDYAIQHPSLNVPEEESLPTLKDVLDLAQSYPKLQLHIELKTDALKQDLSSDPYKLTITVLDELKKSKVKNRCWILAFDWRVHKILKEQDNSVPMVFLYQGSTKISENPELLQLYPAEELKGLDNSVPKMIAQKGGAFWSVDYSCLTEENINEAHALGLKVNAWTPNSEKEMQHLISLGVDAITTDYPDILKNVLKYRYSISPHKQTG